MDTKTHYLRIYKAAEEILQQPDNPCQIRIEAGKPTCTATRAGARGFRSPELCCSRCQHLGPNGCTIQSLWCKLGWCWGNASAITGMKTSDHPTFIKLKALRDEAEALGVPMPPRNQPFPLKG